MKGFAIPALNLSKVQTDEYQHATPSSGRGGTPTRLTLQPTNSKTSYSSSPIGTPRRGGGPTIIAVSSSGRGVGVPPIAATTAALRTSSSGPIIAPNSPTAQPIRDAASSFALLPASLDGAFLHVNVEDVTDIGMLRQMVLDARTAVRALDQAYAKQLEVKQRIIEIRMRQLDEALNLRVAVSSTSSAAKVSVRVPSPGNGTGMMRPARPSSAGSSRGGGANGVEQAARRGPSPTVGGGGGRTSTTSPSPTSQGRIAGKSPLSHNGRGVTQGDQPRRATAEVTSNFGYADTTTTRLRLAMTMNRMGDTSSGAGSPSTSTPRHAPAQNNQPWSSQVPASTWVPPSSSRSPTDALGFAEYNIGSRSSVAPSSASTGVQSARGISSSGAAVQRVYTVPHHNPNGSQPMPFRSTNAPPVIAPKSPRSGGTGPNPAAAAATAVFTKPYTPASARTTLSSPR